MNQFQNGADVSISYDGRWFATRYPNLAEALQSFVKEVPDHTWRMDGANLVIEPSDQSENRWRYRVEPAK